LQTCGRTKLHKKNKNSQYKQAVIVFTAQHRCCQLSEVVLVFFKPYNKDKYSNPQVLKPKIKYDFLSIFIKNKQTNKQTTVRTKCSLPPSQNRKAIAENERSS